MHYACFGLALFALLSHLVASLTVVWMRKKRARQARACPTVSILKPLRGIDDQLEANLESFFAIDYPAFELVFCTATPKEPALAIVRRLCAQHPEVASKVVVGTAPVGLNPKVQVLAQATPAAKGELLVVSDSNVRVRPGFLRETLSELEAPDVAVASNLIAGVGERSLGATLENLQLNGFITPAICLGLALRAPTCVVGKSMVVRRADLEAIGGWAPLGNVLAEDFVLGQKLAARGRRAVISPHVVETVNEHWSLGRFVERHDRWLKMRWRINPVALFFELAANVTFWSVVGVVAAGSSAQSLAAAGLLICGRTLVEAISTSQIRPGGRLLTLALVPARDLALAALWFHARLSRTIRWREGQRLLVGPLSELSRPEPLAPIRELPTALGLPDASAKPALTTATREI